MVRLPFTYADYQETRERLSAEIHASLTVSEREFLISFKAGEPSWKLIPLSRLAEMLAVKWKLLNIRKLIERNPGKHEKMLDALKKALA